jgi:uncharacterized GH25 family protein
MKKTFFILLAFLFVLPVVAHEFWLQPDKYIYKKNETANISFLVGENFEGENWSGSRIKVKSLQFYHLKNKTNLSGLLADTAGSFLQLPLKNEGTMMVTFNSNNSFIALDAVKFNEYLTEDGLSNAIAYREQHHETDSGSKEFYQRSVKTIFQVGKPADNTFSNPTDLPLDITPLQNPYALKMGDSITVRVLFRKQILAGYKIKLWHKENNETIHTDLQSDEKGLIKFPIILKGKWMVSAVKMEPVMNNPKANWQSYWGSCTWGYQ